MFKIEDKLRWASDEAKDVPPSTALGCMFGGGVLVGSIFGFAASFVGIIIGLTISLYADAWRRKDHRITSKAKLKRVIQEASQLLAHRYVSSYEDWVLLKTLLDKAENLFLDRAEPTDEELLDRFCASLSWYGPDNWFVRSYFDQYKHRQSFTDHAMSILKRKTLLLKRKEQQQ